MFRKTIKKNKNTNNITADLNKVLSQSLLSINEKIKRDKEKSKGNNAINTNSVYDQALSSMEVAKTSVITKADKVVIQQEYSVPNKNEKEKLTPCVAYGARTETKSGQIADSSYAEQQPAQSRSKADAPVQYYEDVP